MRGRSQEWSDEALGRQAELERRAASGDFVATAGSDFHGKRSANYQWNFIPAFELDRATMTDAEVTRVVWEALAGERPILVATVEMPRPPSVFRGFLAPPWVFVQYVRQLDVFKRAVWMGWMLLGAGVIIAGRRRR